MLYNNVYNAENVNISLSLSAQWLGPFMYNDCDCQIDVANNWVLLIYIIRILGKQFFSFAQDEWIHKISSPAVIFHR